MSIYSPVPPPYRCCEQDRPLLYFRAVLFLFLPSLPYRTSRDLTRRWLRCTTYVARYHYHKLAEKPWFAKRERAKRPSLYRVLVKGGDDSTVSRYVSQTQELRLRKQITLKR